MHEHEIRELTTEERENLTMFIVKLIRKYDFRQACIEARIFLGELPIEASAMKENRYVDLMK